MGDSLREPFIIDVTELSEAIYVVAVSGEMDIATSPELASRLSTVRGPVPYHVLIDLSELGFMDSTGIKVLAMSAKDVERHGGTLIVFGATPNVRRVFDIVQFSDVVSVVESLDDAVGRAQQSEDGAASTVEG